MKHNGLNAPNKNIYVDSEDSTRLKAFNVSILLLYSLPALLSSISVALVETCSWRVGENNVKMGYEISHLFNKLRPIDRQLK